MKKILLASTALVASAGFAAADISMTGSAAFGIADNNAPGVAPTFIEDVDINFSMSGETDGGISFGVSVNLDEAAGLAATTNNGTELWLKSDFGNLTLGDTDGGFDWAMQEVGMGGSLASDHTTHAGYNGNSGLDGTYDNQVLRYDNTFGDFGVALSVEADDTGVGPIAWGLGVKYNANLGAADIGVGLGYQKAGAANIWGISLDTKLDSGLSAVVNYSRANTGVSHSAIGLGYTKDALTIAANYGRYSTGSHGYGIAVNYDLGGGAVVMFGYGNDNDTPAAAVPAAPPAPAVAAVSSSSWSLGLALSF